MNSNSEKDILSYCSCENCELKALFFNHFDKSELARICSDKIEKTYKKGQIIFKQGDDIQDFIYLKSGLVKLFRQTENNKEQIIAIAKPLEFVSIMGIFSTRYFSYSVTAIEESVTCSIDIETIKNLALTSSHLAFNILEKICSTTDRIIIDMMNIREKHLRGRIAVILLQFAENIYQKNEFELPISRKELAEYIGMTTENVIRILSEFRKDKLIKINGKGIEIQDFQRLKQIADFG
jgi:CRP-like cAMP-binding protein